MLADLSPDRHYAFPVKETAHHTSGTALIETAAALVRKPALAGDLRRVQKAIDRDPRVASVFRQLLESKRPDDMAYVRQHGLRALRLPAGPKYTFVERRGERPTLVETAPAMTQKSDKVLPKMDDRELTIYLHSGLLPGQY